MDFLDKFVIPLSPEHISLLHYISMLIFFLFVPFISIIIGGTAVSLYYKSKGMKESNNIYLRFAKDIIEIVTINKGIGIILGIVTLFTSIIIYIQLFHSGNLDSVSYLSGSVLLIAIGLILVYTYRYSLSFSELFDAMKDFKSENEEVTEELIKFRHGSKSLSSKSGKFGLIFLILGTWLFVAGVTIAAYPASWGDKNILMVIFSAAVIFRFIPFLLMAAAFTGAAVLFAVFYWDGGRKNIDEDYADFIKKTSVNLSIGGAVLLPLFILVDLLLLPGDALSYTVFGYSTLALLLIFLGYHYLYVMFKEKSAKYSGHIFFVLLLAIMALIVRNQTAMGNANQLQTVLLQAQFTEVMQKLTGESAAPKISGEEIYKNICSACHSFDHKVVGPPYKQTLPKYKGNVDKLVAFILNPKQNNPGYPPMPNPGLKRDQARAVATYILKEVKKYE